MTAPTTYSDWAAVLERFGNGDDTVFEEMNAGNFTLDAGTAQRFYSRVEEVYKKRKQNWLDKFQRNKIGWINSNVLFKCKISELMMILALH